MGHDTTREQAREAGRQATYVSDQTSAELAADAASDVWAKDYEALAELLADESIAPQKRIGSALAWIKDTIR